MIQALSSTATATTSTAAPTGRRPSAEEMFKKLDSDGKGYLTESDVAKISPKGAAKAEEAFKDMDSDGDGKVTESEFKAAGEKMEKAHQAEGGGKGARPAGGPHGGGGGGAQAASSSSSSSSEIKDPADANQDGKVSEQEQQAYDARQAQAQAAVKTYEDVAAAQ